MNALKNTNEIIRQEIKITQARIKHQRETYKSLTSFCNKVFHELNYLEAIKGTTPQKRVSLKYMNIPTPRTNAAASESIVKVYETSLQLETELTTALAEIDRLDVAGIHSCHANCQKSMCVMRRELTSATEQRDEMTRYANKLAHGFPDGMLPKDVEVLREANLGLAVELTAVTEQRDRLAEGNRDFKDMLRSMTKLHAIETTRLSAMVTYRTEQQNELKEENKHLKDQLATLSKTHATDMQRLSDMIDERQEALRYISEIIEEKSAERENLELGSTAYKTVRRWASFFLDNSQTD